MHAFVGGAINRIAGVVETEELVGIECNRTHSQLRRCDEVEPVKSMFELPPSVEREQSPYWKQP